MQRYGRSARQELTRKASRRSPPSPDSVAVARNAAPLWLLLLGHSQLARKAPGDCFPATGACVARLLIGDLGITRAGGHAQMLCHTNAIPPPEPPSRLPLRLGSASGVPSQWRPSTTSRRRRVSRTRASRCSRAQLHRFSVHRGAGAERCCGGVLATTRTGGQAAPGSILAASPRALRKSSRRP